MTRNARTKREFNKIARDLTEEGYYRIDHRRSMSVFMPNYGKDEESVIVNKGWLKGAGL